MYSCMHFESMGIHCCHMIYIMKNEHMRETPPSYIIRRWLKSGLGWAKIVASGECYDFERQTAHLGIFASRCDEIRQYAILTEEGWIEANDVVTTLTCRLKDLCKQKSGLNRLQPNLV